MPLREEHLATRPFCGAPLLDVLLQRPQLAVGELAGVLSLQRLENRLRLQAVMRQPSRRSDVPAAGFANRKRLNDALSFATRKRSTPRGRDGDTAHQNV